MDEGIVEGGEDTGDTEDELACAETVSLFRCLFDSTWAHTIADGGAQGDVLLGSTGDLLGGHFENGRLLVTRHLAVENEVHQTDFSRGASLVVVDLPARAVGCGRKPRANYGGRGKKRSKP